MIFDKLTNLDKKNIKNYIAAYATAYNNTFCENAGLDVVLAEWNKQKEKLYHLFGGKFIVSQKISYKESENELDKKLSDILFNNSNNIIFKNKILALYPYKKWEIDLSPEEKEEREKTNELHYIVSQLFDYYVLRKNNFIGPSSDKHKYTLPLPNKSYKIQNGMKPMKILKTLADTYHISGFEEFRNAHSRCLQTKQITGELCFSIHPLDYMTMSDNDCGWNSCMSWKECGEFRVGTVEMMNSPNVVVAYLKSDTTDYKFSGGTWNSKKWRCLFIVDKDFIISVKSYPFYNENLTKIATTKLAELIGWGKIKPTQYDYDNTSVIANNNVKFYLETETIGMYNDFGNEYAHWVIVNPFVQFEYNRYCDTEYCYSGIPTCMNCGKELSITEEGDETALICADLDDCNYYYCDKCGNRVRYSENTYEVENCILCDCCFDNDAVLNAFTNGYIFEENAIQVFLSTSNDKFKKSVNYCSIWISDKNIDAIVKPYQGYYFIEDVTNLHYDDNTEEYWIAPNELTEEGLELFNIFSQETLKRYMANPERKVDFL